MNWTSLLQHFEAPSILKNKLEVITNTTIPTWFQCGNHRFPWFLHWGVTAAAQEKASLQELQVCWYGKTLVVFVDFGSFGWVKWVFRQCPAFCLKGRFLSMEYLQSHSQRHRPCFLRSMLTWFATWILQNTALGVQSKVWPGWKKKGTNLWQKFESKSKVQSRNILFIKQLTMLTSLFCFLFFSLTQKGVVFSFFFSVGKSAAKVSSTPKRQRLSKPWRHSWPWPMLQRRWGPGEMTWHNGREQAKQKKTGEKLTQKICVFFENLGWTFEALMFSTGNMLFRSCLFLGILKCRDLRSSGLQKEDVWWERLRARKKCQVSRSSSGWG